MFIVVRGVFISFSFLRSMDDRLRTIFRFLGNEGRRFLSGLGIARVAKEGVVRGRRGLLQGDLGLITFNANRLGRVKVLLIQRSTKANNAFVKRLRRTRILAARRTNVGHRLQRYSNGEDRHGQCITFRLTATRLNVRRVMVR